MTRTPGIQRSFDWKLAALALVLAAVVLPATAVAQDRPQGDAGVGRGIYQAYCVSCHGDFGEGDGPVAEHLKIPPADLTKLHERWGGEFDADIAFRAILGEKKVRAHGNSEMPIWGDAFKNVIGGQSDEQVMQKIADLVAFLGSIQRK